MRRIRPESYEVDPTRCRRCGREALGLRCDVPLTEGFERSLGGRGRCGSTMFPVVDNCYSRRAALSPIETSVADTNSVLAAERRERF